jgi:hypothetical protein
MPEMMTKEAGANAPAFVLRDLKSSDVWQLVRVLRKFNIKAAAEAIDKDALKASKFKTPTKMVDGEIVPMLPDEWTEAQRKAFKAAQAANDVLVWQFLDILINNIGGCEDEVNKLLAMGIEKDVNYVRNMDANDYLSLIVQYVTREGFIDFFTQARNLLEKTGTSRSSIGSVATLIK